MGKSKQTQTQESSQSGQSQTTFAPRSAQEQAILDQYKSLGDQQYGFLNNLISGNQSPFALNPADQAQLDQAYGSAFNQFDQSGKDYVDYLSTTRGLNKSDTPVSQQALQRYGLGMSDLLSQKANAGLNLGLQGTNMRLMGSQALPAGLGASFSPLWQERMAGGLTKSSGKGSSSTTMIQNPSLMTQIGQGMGLATQAIDLGGKVGGMFMNPTGFMTNGIAPKG